MAEKPTLNVFLRPTHVKREVGATVKSYAIERCKVQYNAS
jgi:hypothetical protein